MRPAAICTTPIRIRHARIILGVLALIGIFHLACDEPHLVASVDENIPPSFNFAGKGSLPFFVILELPSDLQSREDMKRAKVIWKIRPTDSFHARVPSGLIRYGTVPEGFVQVIPLNNSAPPQLEENRIYQAGGPPIEMPQGFSTIYYSAGASSKSRSINNYNLALCNSLRTITVRVTESPKNIISEKLIRQGRDATQADILNFLNCMNAGN
jgi:hypothetical protein